MSNAGEGAGGGEGAPQRPQSPTFADLDYAGIPGSPPVTDKGASSVQLRPKKLSHRLKYVAQLVAMGLTQREISERTGYSPHRLSILTNAPLVSNEVERTRRHIFERDAERALKTMLPKALEAIDQALGESVSGIREHKQRADIGFALLERTHGKPKQQVEIGGNLLSDLYAMLDAKDNDRAASMDAAYDAASGIVEAEFTTSEIESDMGALVGAAAPSTPPPGETLESILMRDPFVDPTKESEE